MTMMNRETFVYLHVNITLECLNFCLGTITGPCMPHSYDP